MKNFCKKFLVICAIVIAASAITNFFTPQDTNAAGDCRYILGLTSWDCNTNLVDNGNGLPSEDQLKTGIWIAVANVLTDVTVIAAYLVLGYTIYGGYLYVFSRGESGKVATGKSALTQAFIGLAIVLLANVILNSIRIALGNVNLTADCATTGNCYDMNNAGTMITETIKWVVGIAGIVAAIFVVYGGISYSTSAGDPGKLKKAKDMIMYALIGLAIVALAEIITGFVSNTINNAALQTNQTTIAKEVHEKIH